MTLEKAIAALQAHLMRPGSVDKVDFQDAEQLGIEALKRLITLRDEPHLGPLALLPSETV